MDFLAFEPQFLDHLAPVWHALPEDVRGEFFVDETLAERALAKDIDFSPVSGPDIRSSTRAPDPRPAEGPKAVVASVGDIKVGRRLGYRNFAFLEHGAGQAYFGRGTTMKRHPSYAGGMDREDNSLFLVPNEYCGRIWREAYPQADTRVIGCPKLDTLPRKERSDPPVVALSFHWPAFVAPEAGTALGDYLPVLQEFGRAFNVVGHAHPKGDWPKRVREYYAKAGIGFEPDFDEICRTADVYVCDNSSTIFEFAATGRPVVVLNAKSWRKDANHGLRFWDAARVGLNVDDPKRLIETVTLALTDPPEVAQAREEALDIVYAFRSGAALRAAAALVEWA